MFATTAQTLVSLVMLYLGGELLIRGASVLASRLGVSTLAIGLTVVAFGTSAPELVVSLDAALSGANDISVGNVIGSNIANIALILGLASLIRPSTVHARIIGIDAPIMIAASLALLAVMAGGRASRLEGSLLLFGLAAYTVFTFWSARREFPPVREEIASAAPPQTGSTLSASSFVLGGLTLLAAGGHLLVTAATDLATSLGISEAAIGLTIVAIGTSLPELATSVIASVRGQGDIAIGNVVGSNIFNILGILGVTAVVRPLDLGAITWIDLGVMSSLAVVVTALVSIRRRLGRIEGALLLTAYVFYSRWLLVT